MFPESQRLHTPSCFTEFFRGKLGGFFAESWFASISFALVIYRQYLPSYIFQQSVWSNNNPISVWPSTNFCSGVSQVSFQVIWTTTSRTARWRFQCATAKIHCTQMCFFLFFGFDGFIVNKSKDSKDSKAWQQFLSCTCGQGYRGPPTQPFANMIRVGSPEKTLELFVQLHFQSSRSTTWGGWYWPTLWYRWIQLPQVGNSFNYF